LRWVRQSSPATIPSDGFGATRRWTGIETSETLYAHLDGRSLSTPFQRYFVTVMDHPCITKRLGLETAVDGGIARLSVDGDIDLGTAGEFEIAGLVALTRHGVNTLAINLTAVRFISAAGLGALVAINNEARRRGQLVLLAEPSRCVSRIIELTSLTDTFSVTADTQNQLPAGPPT
jgi:anti-sigma B factor antagonist